MLFSTPFTPLPIAIGTPQGGAKSLLVRELRFCSVPRAPCPVPCAITRTAYPRTDWRTDLCLCCHLPSVSGLLESRQSS